MEDVHEAKETDTSMNGTSTRGMLIVFGIVIVALVVLAVVGNLLSQILPLTIALVIGLVLGRMSASVNLVDLIRGAILRQPAARKPQVQKRETPTEQPIRAEQPARTAPETRLADEPEAKPEIRDFVIKSEADVLAEARQREEQLKQQQASADEVRAALEERRRRLRGDQE